MNRLGYALPGNAADPFSISLVIFGLIFNVVSARIPITGSSYNNEQTLARACALMATLCYDKPTSYDDLREQYFATSDSFINGTEEFYNYLKTNKGTCMSWPFEALDTVREFYYIWEDNNMFFSTVDFSE